METPAEKKQVRVTIYNQSFSLVTSEDPAEIQSLAAMVDDLISGIAARSGNVEPTRLLILACLHLADQLRGLDRDLSDLRRRVEQKAQQFSGLLDQIVE
jgi:cell division protein ZapA (FtsZ GTPase activity inhibitor)